MNKYLFYCMIFIVCFSACSSDDLQTDNSVLEILPIENISLPESFEYNMVYTIYYDYTQPTNCHAFYNLYYDANGDERIIAVVNRKHDNGNCQSTDNQIIRSFDFHCTKQQGVYIFKLWQGENSDGEDEYLTYEIPVID